MKKRILAVICAAFLLMSGTASALEAEVRVNEEKHAMPETLYGIFLEDINQAVDGGLCAELVQNGSFENQGLPEAKESDRWEAWSRRGDGTAEIFGEKPIHENNPHYVRVTPGEQGLKLLNRGFYGNALRGGIHVRAGIRYDFSMFVRAAEGTCDLSVSLTKMGGAAVGEPVQLSADGTEWSEVSATFTAEEDADVFLQIEVTGDGAVDLDMVSLLPGDRYGAEWPGGGVRADLCDALMELHPGFLRFPGGCVAEGSYLRENAYNWKDTIGPKEERRQIGNVWGGMQTCLMGFYEYFCLSEMLGAMPLPVVHAGVLCQARDAIDARALTIEETKAYAQDLIDLCEFALGGTDTEWGAVRAEMGHPEPFDMRYLAIGNENWDQIYFTRYEILSEAVKEVWPEVICVVAAGPVAEGALISNSWNSIRRSFKDSVADEHYYMDSDWLRKHTARYDLYPRTVKVCLGEYAAHEPVKGSIRPNNLYAALCEAAYLTGIERNADLVEMSCYAPLLAREGEQDWSPNLIWFNDTQVLKTPSYYVQKMFSDARGETYVECSIEDAQTDGMTSAFISATRTEDRLMIKVVSFAEEAITISLPGVPDGEVKVTALSGDESAVNGFGRENVAPKEGVARVSGEALDYTPDAGSLTIFEIALNADR